MRQVVDEIARRQQGFEGTGAASLRIAQRLSVGFHAGNAHAVLRRLSLPLPSVDDGEGLEWSGEGAEKETEPDSNILDG